jgi:hypothetical protein
MTCDACGAEKGIIIGANTSWQFTLYRECRGELFSEPFDPRDLRKKLNELKF